MNNRHSRRLGYTSPNESRHVKGYGINKYREIDAQKKMLNPMQVNLHSSMDILSGLLRLRAHIASSNELERLKLEDTGEMSEELDGVINEIMTEIKECFLDEREEFSISHEGSMEREFMLEKVFKSSSGRMLQGVLPLGKVELKTKYYPGWNEPGSTSYSFRLMKDFDFSITSAPKATTGDKLYEEGFLNIIDYIGIKMRETQAEIQSIVKMEFDALKSGLYEPLLIDGCSQAFITLQPSKKGLNAFRKYLEESGQGINIELQGNLVVAQKNGGAEMVPHKRLE